MRTAYSRATRNPLRSLRDSSGQSLMEFALIMPLALVLALGVVETGYVLLDQHVVTKIAREGANLISRETPLPQAAQAIASMSTSPINFSDGSSKLILSVVKRGSTTGTANFGHMVLWQRYTYGSFPASSQLNGSGTFPAPEYTAPNSDTNTALRVTNLGSLATVDGGMVYVAEIYTKHELITPFGFFNMKIARGRLLPSVLYSVAYF